MPPQNYFKQNETLYLRIYSIDYSFWSNHTTLLKVTNNVIDKVFDLKYFVYCVFIRNRITLSLDHIKP